MLYWLLILLTLSSNLAFCDASERKIHQIIGNDDEADASIQTGPTAFFDGSDFRMSISGKGIKIAIYRNVDKAKRLAVLTLDKPAVSIKGSKVKTNSYQVNLDWKDQNFNSGSTKLEGMNIQMTFDLLKTEYYLSSIVASNFIINSTHVPSSELSIISSNGHKVIAPLGLSFCCTDLGMFGPKKLEAESFYKVGIILPGLQLQVFDLAKGGFGGEWSCDYLIPIGLWIGFLLSLFFAVVCFWAFSMLANIETMDRFDDPKSKPIHVPVNE